METHENHTKCGSLENGAVTNMNIASYAVSHAHWSFDVQRKLLYVDGEVVRLQRGVLQLLLFLVRREGDVISKEELIEAVWGGREVSDAAMYNRVSALRQALRDADGPDERCIQWEYGHGLRFARPRRRKDDPPFGQSDMPMALGPAKDAAPADLATPQGPLWAGMRPICEWEHLLGAYHTIYRTPSWPDAIKVGVTVLRAVEGKVVVWTAERGQDPNVGIKQRARYRGWAEFIDGRVFIKEQNCKPPRSICMKTLDAPHAYRPDIMTGLMHGSSWRLGGAPYATRVVWRRVPAEMSLREALSLSGPTPNDTKDIEPAILNSIGPDCLTFQRFDSLL